MSRVVSQGVADERIETLRKADRRLRRHDARRAELLAARDAAILQALDAGCTWVAIQGAISVGPATIRQVIARSKKPDFD